MKKLMIVNDSGFISSSLISLIVESGFDIIGKATDGTSAVKMYEHLQPDIVVLDITISELMGVNTIKMLKSVNKDVRIIVVSATPKKDTVWEILKADVVSLIIKPLDRIKY